MFNPITAYRAHKAAQLEAKWEQQAKQYTKELAAQRAEHPENTASVEPRLTGHTVSRIEHYDLGQLDQLETAFKTDEARRPSSIVTLADGNRYWLGMRDRDDARGMHKTQNIETAERGPNVLVQNGCVNYSVTYTSGPLFADNVRKLLDHEAKVEAVELQ